MQNTASTGERAGSRGLRLWLAAARPKTLWAAVSPVILGSAAAVSDGAFHAPAALAALLGAVLIQIGTNYSNDYHDFVKGADTGARKGPLRATQAGLVSPTAMRAAAAVTFAAAVVVGLYLIWRGGLPILIIGILSVVSGVWYTAGRYSLAYLGLADLFVLVFFGPVAVAGTYYVQALSVSPAVILAGLGPGALAVAILLVNNIRDVDEDREAGKRTLVVRLGRGTGIQLYVAMLILAALIPLMAAAAADVPAAVAVAGAVPIAGWQIVNRLKHERDARHLNPLLGKTSQLLFAYCLTFSLAWMIG